MPDRELIERAKALLPKRRKRKKNGPVVVKQGHQPTLEERVHGLIGRARCEDYKKEESKARGGLWTPP